MSGALFTGAAGIVGPGTPGFGVAVDRAALDRYAVRTWNFTP